MENTPERHDQNESQEAFKKNRGSSCPGELFTRYKDPVLFGSLKRLAWLQTDQHPVIDMGYVWYRPKSKTSARRIYLGPTVMTELKKWRIACPPTNLDLVFPNGAGKPIDRSLLLNKVFFPALKNAGIDRIRFHDLRHTYASLMIHQGENIKYIQSQLGHSSPTDTLNVYAHLMTPVNQQAARKLRWNCF